MKSLSTCSPFGARPPPLAAEDVVQQVAELVVRERHQVVERQQPGASGRVSREGADERALRELNAMDARHDLAAHRDRRLAVPRLHVEVEPSESPPRSRTS